MALLTNISSVYGRVSAVNPTASRNMKIVYVSGVPLEIPSAEHLIPLEKRKPKVLVFYHETERFPVLTVIALFVSPRRSTWIVLQEAARLGVLTDEMLVEHRPKLLWSNPRVRSI